MFQMTISSKGDDMPPPFSDPKTLQDYYFLQQSAISVGKRRIPKNGDSTEDELQQPEHVSKSPVRRLPTPDKVRILEMADSFNKHRLRKQQQLLSEIAQRCREQEVADMSSEITRKCKMSNQDERLFQKEPTFYITARMGRRVHGNADTPDVDPTGERGEASSPSQRPMYERSKTFFPERKAKHMPAKDFTLQHLSPRLQFCYRKGVRPSAMYNQSNLAKSRKINGPIQLDHYQPRDDQLAPLILPSVKYVGYTRDNVESYVTSSKISLGPRSSSSLPNMSPQRDQTWSNHIDQESFTPSGPTAQKHNKSPGKPRLSHLMLEL